MERIAERIYQIDLAHLGRLNVIASAIIELNDGIAIVDPGPSSTLPALRAGLAAGGWSLVDVRWLLVTHVHLDHAGACGEIVRQHPGIQVVVHEKGARHLEDPTRLMSSAQRVFGNDLERLWGDFLPVPSANLRRVNEGDSIHLELAGRRLDIAYTPGHASHHVSYYDETTGLAFVGDSTGARICDADLVLPTTPAPDIDLQAIHTSAERILSWNPERLFLTHFGPATNVAEHMSRHLSKLDAWSQYVKDALRQQEEDDQALADRFFAWVHADLEQSLTVDQTLAYEQGAATHLSWHGLARYWRTKPSE